MSPDRCRPANRRDVCKSGEAQLLRQIYQREDYRRFAELFPALCPGYHFGPTPVVWSRRVWQALDEQMLKPRNMSFADAIKEYPSELNWYGVAYLSYRPFPLYPREPVFRLYGYQEEYWRHRRLGETDAKLAQNYLGVTSQSAWDKALDYDRIKVIRRKLRTFLKYLFGRW